MTTITITQWIITKFDLHCYRGVGIYSEQNLEMIRTLWLVIGLLGEGEAWKNVWKWQ